MSQARTVTSLVGGVDQGGNRWGPPDKAKALERLAEARARLAGLERQSAPAVDPSIRTAVEQRQQQIVTLARQLRAGKRGRAARQARQQMEALEGTQRMVIECLGFRDYGEFQAMTAREDATRVDGRVLAEARHEVERAERHFFDTAEMAVPVPQAWSRGQVSPRPAPHYGMSEPRWAAG